MAWQFSSPGWFSAVQASVLKATLASQKASSAPSVEVLAKCEDLAEPRKNRQLEADQNCLGQEHQGLSLTAAISDAIEIVSTSVLEADQRSQLQAISKPTDRFEGVGARAIDA